MNEWMVVGVIVTLVGLFLTIGRPILELNKSMVTYGIEIRHNSQEVSSLKDEIKAQREDARNSHQRLWDHNDKQDEKLNDHEQRIGLLENK